MMVTPGEARARLPASRAGWLAMVSTLGGLMLPAGAGRAEPGPEAPASAAAATGVWRMSVAARMAYRAPADGTSVDLDPKLGLSFGASLERRHTGLGSRADLAAGFELYFDRFARSVTGSAATEQGKEIPFDGVRAISQATFAASETLSVQVGPWRPFVGVAGGVAVGYFTSDERDLRPGEARATRPMARGALGLDFDLSLDSGLVLRGDFTRIFNPPAFQTAEGRRLVIFGDLVDLGLAFRLRF